MTTEHGEARDYDGMQAVLRQVADKRRRSRQELDRISGLPSGFCSTVLSENPGRRLGPDTIGPLNTALGIKWVAVDDPEALAKFTALGDERVEYKARKPTDDRHKIIVVKITKRRMKYLSNLATKARKRIPKRKRAAMARKAARARWHKLNVKIKPGDLAEIRKPSQGTLDAATAAARAAGTLPAIAGTGLFRPLVAGFENGSGLI
jgi:protein required for attachment to host cells